MSQDAHSREAAIRRFARRSDFEAIFDASPDAMLLVGGDSLIRGTNSRAEVMFGWSRALDRVISDLMPVELEGHSLEFALRILCRRAEDDGFVVERDIRRVDDVLDAEGRLAVFRIVQEALNNARRHSGAGRATVRYRRDGRQLRAEVGDAGAGFSPDDLEPHLSVGLAGMRERGRILGGRLTVSSEPGAGTSVLLEVPVRSGPPPGDDAS